MLLLLILTFCFFWAFAAHRHTISARATAARGDHDLSNAPQIFNAIHSSMRQWGSSLNHNGMSFFLATVPEGTQFYHGTGTQMPINGTQWLAFEPEHAMLFARIGGPGVGPGGPKDPDDHKKPPEHRGEDELEKPSGAKWRRSSMLDMTHSPLTMQKPSESPPRPPWGPGGPHGGFKPGWLHSYTTNRDLNLLYIDGMSGAKSAKGTLDSQDYVLLNSNALGGVFDDWRRAQNLCAVARDRWDDRIDGFLRMEAGFEIILCAFEKSLDVVRITRMGSSAGRGWSEDEFSYFQAITTRYHGIGGNRVTLDYDKFITAYAYHDIKLDPITRFDSMPRLRNVSNTTRTQMMADLDDIITNAEGTVILGLNWQAIADEIVVRYATRLQNLVSGKLSSLKECTAELYRLLLPFIDYDDRNVTAEIERCAMQFIPPSRSDSPTGASLARAVVTNISMEICATLRSAMDVIDLDVAVDDIRALIKKLDWTIWKECAGSCATDEICLTAIWPHGSKKDRKHPSCQNATGLLDGNGYWDHFGGPPPKL